MCGEACPADRCETVPAMLGSWSDRPRIGTATSGFIFTIWIFKIWWKSRTKASFSRLPLSLFEGSLERKLCFHIFHLQILREVSHERFVFISSTCMQILMEVSHESFVFTSSTFTSCRRLARKLRSHIFHLHFLREVSHESFVFISSTFTFWGTSRTKASSSNLQRSDFEGKSLAKASFSHLPRADFEGSLARNAFLRDSRCTKCCVLQDKTCLGTCVGKLVRRTGSLCSDDGRIGPASSGFIFTIWTFKFWRKSRTKASFSHLPLSLFEGSLARKLNFHILQFHFLKEVSHESFISISSTFTLWGKSRTKASFPYLLLSLLEGSLARNHESFIFTSSTFTFWGASRTTASFSHLPLSDFEELLARRKLRFRIFHLQMLRAVWHEMHFWELADARNAVFCRTRRLSEDGWGSLSGGRFFCFLQYSLCRSHCNGCVKVAWRRGYVRSTIVFCS